MEHRIGITNGIKMQKVLNYDTQIFSFKDCVEDIFNTNNLTSLHERKSYDVFKRMNDQETIFHETFYSKFHNNHKFVDVYENFISKFVIPNMKLETVIYQKVPTFRCHLEGNKAVGEFHKDSDYNHPKEEINFFVPLTEAKDTSTIWIESEPEKEDYRPINLKYGQVFIFNGGLYKHGNKVNETGKTRVGFDFRIIRPDEYTFSNKTSLNVVKKFIVGEYYHIKRGNNGT